MSELSKRKIPHIIWILIICTMPHWSSDLYSQSAQQEAIVKTRGKQSLTGDRIPGERISGAVVKIKDGNYHKSGQDGMLSFPVQNGRYSVESVNYKDYVMLDSDELNRVQYYSKDTKSIVIVSTWEMNEDRYEEEIRMKEQSEKRYRESREEIRRLKEELKISSDSANVLLAALNEVRMKEDALIKDFAERYSKIDFDSIDDFNNEWAFYIRTGQLDKADSLLRTSGDLSSLETEYWNMRKDNEHGRAVIASKEDELKKDKALQSENEKKENDRMLVLADRYFKSFEIAALRHNQDSALLYLERRVALDTTNVSWLVETADYATTQQKFQQAESYYLKALDICQRNNDIGMTAILINLGNLYIITGRYDESETIFLKEVEKWRRLASENPKRLEESSLAICLSGLGAVYFETGRFSESEELFLETLEIWKRLASENPKEFEEELARCLGNLGSIYVILKQFSESEAFIHEALEIWRRLVSENPGELFESELATCLYNLTIVYAKTGQMSKGEKVCLEAVEIWRRLASENPGAFEKNLAEGLEHMGSVYINTGRISESEELCLEALEIWRRLTTENPGAFEDNLAECLKNLGIVYISTGRFHESEKVFIEELEIWQRLVPENPRAFEDNLARCLTNLGLVYGSTGRMNERQKMLLEELVIRRRLASENPKVFGIDLAHCLSGLGLIYGSNGQFSESEKMFLEELEIWRRMASENPMEFEDDLAECLSNLGLVYGSTGRMNERQKMLLEELVIRRRLASENPGESEVKLAQCLTNLGIAYGNTGRFAESVKMFLESVNIWRHLAKENPQAYLSQFASQLSNLSYVYLLSGEFSKAEQYARECIMADASQNVINAFLATSLLFQGKYIEAEQIYIRYKDELKDTFLGFFQSFEEGGVIPDKYKEDVEAIKTILNGTDRL